MKDSLLSTILLLTVFLMGIGTGTFIEVARRSSEIHQQAIEKGFAHYNPTNGVWQWKE